MCSSFSKSSDDCLGIGGGATAYYLSTNFSSGLIAIDIFERSDRVGGRLREIVIDGGILSDLKINQQIIVVFSRGRTWGRCLEYR
jgi:hypothetical protein